LISEDVSAASVQTHESIVNEYIDGVLTTPLSVPNWVKPALERESRLRAH
jgi:hypothetical protein